MSKLVVNYAKEHCSAIVLENLGNIAKREKTRKYVQKSQWSFYQLETFLKYKAALLGIPIVYINPAYTSQICSRCGDINKPNGKRYKCNCGHFDHRDSNAAFNISAKGKLIYEQTIEDRDSVVRHIGSPLTQSSERAVQLESFGGIQ